MFNFIPNWEKYLCILEKFWNTNYESVNIVIIIIATDHISLQKWFKQRPSSIQYPGSRSFRSNRAHGWIDQHNNNVIRMNVCPLLLLSRPFLVYLGFGLLCPHLPFRHLSVWCDECLSVHPNSRHISEQTKHPCPRRPLNNSAAL